MQTSSIERLAVQFGAADTTDGWQGPRYNVPPSTRIPTVIQPDERRLGMLRWGYVPSWTKDPDTGPRPINARIEGAADSRLFAPALTRRRAIVPLDAWYEWTDEDGVRQPWLLRPLVDAPLAAAAIWSVWRAQGAPSDAPPLGTVAIMTTEARGPAAAVHHRMPLIVPDELLEAWLDVTLPVDAALVDSLRAFAPEVSVLRVSRRVNDVRNDDPALLDPQAER